MATKTTIERICDITGDPAVDTVEFAYRGTSYKIDLSAEAVADFNAAMAGFVESAEKLGRVNSSARPQRVSSSSSSGRSREQLTAIRQWAMAQGLPVSNRGRISSEVLEKFEAAHAA